MTLAEQLYSMMQANQKAMQPTDLVVGTVTSAEPLEISINSAMEPLRREVLLLTESVVEKKIPVLEHGHTVGGLSHSHTVTGLGHAHGYDSSTKVTDSALSGSYPTDSQLAGSYPSGEALADIAVLEHGQALPVENGYILLNRGLAAGDKVLLLRVLRGQKFIVLSRVFA